MATVRKTRFTLRYLLVLVLCCTVAWAGVLAYLIATGHGFIWKPDGTALYYTFFIYYGEMLRSGLASLLSGQVPDIPAFTYSQGYGSDIALSLGSNITSPLLLLSVFFDQHTAEFGYSLIAWLRVILSGAAFSLYCFNRGKDHASTLVGSLCYVLCGFMVFWGILRHPIFLSMGVLLPLVMMGADKVFNGERPYWLIGSIALTFLIQEYFEYIICVLLLGYCLVKYFFGAREKTPADFALLVGKFIVFLLIGFAIGAITGWAAVQQIVSMDRVTQETFVPPLFEPIYYLSSIANMLGMVIATRGLFVGIVPLVLVCVFLWCGKRIDRSERRPWLVGLLCVAVMACIPWFGHMLNGFGYVSDRWMIMLGFVLSYIAVLAVPIVTQLESREWLKVGITIGIILAIGTASAFYEQDAMAFVLAIPLVVVAILAVISCMKLRNAAPTALAVLVILGASAASAIYLCPEGGENEVEFIDFGQAYEMVNVKTPSQAIISTGDDEGAYRYSVPWINSNISNDPLIPGLMGIVFYSSMYSQPIDDLRDSLGIWSNHKNYLFGGNDGRLAVDALSGARYFVATDKQRFLVPYTYQDTGIKHEGFKVHRSEHALPIAFATDKAITRSTYDSLSLISRQEALLQGCVLEDVTSSTNVIEPQIASKSLPYEVEAEPGIELQDGAIVVTDVNAHLKLHCKGQEKSETYVCFQNLRFEGMGPIKAKELKGDASEPSLWLRLKDALYTGVSRFTVGAKIGDLRRSFDVNTPKSTAYVSRANWTLNFGYSEQARNDVELDFSHVGTYRFDELSVECQPVDPIVKSLDALKQSGATDIQMDTNRVSARFEHVDDHSYGIVTLPYSDGWTATVDGAPATVLRADLGFMAVDLGDGGDHELVLSYATPGRIEGCIASVVGIIALVGLCLYYRSRERRAISTHKH